MSVTILLISMATSTYSITSFGASAGKSTFVGMDSAYQANGKLILKSGDGLEFDGGLGLLQTNRSGESDTLTIIPVSFGINYELNQRSNISPYLGAFGIVAFVSGIDSPYIGGGAKAGLRFTISPKTRLFFEANTYTSQTESGELLNQQFAAAVGLSIGFQNSEKKIKHKNNRRKNKAARRKMKRRMLR